MNYLKLLSYSTELAKLLVFLEASPNKEVLAKLKIDPKNKRFTFAVYPNPEGSLNESN